MIAIVGAGVAGLSAAEALREHGYGGPVRLFGAEAVGPYERPMLSKSFLSDPSVREPRPLRGADVLAEMEIVLDVGAAVGAIDAQGHTIVTADGQHVKYDALLLATGAEPRRLEIPGATLRGVHYLRDLEDARELRAALRRGGRVTVVGGGVIGLEIAASASESGAEVTVIEAAPRVMARVVPREFSALLEKFHQARGISLRTSAPPIRFEGSAKGVRGVRLQDGTLVEAETVVVGVGVRPRTELASSAGLRVDDGVVVDEHFRSSKAGIFAAGDVARVFHPRERRHVRVEQWQPAEAQGRYAAASILGRGSPYEDVPWMWSDQHDLHIQATGFGFGNATIVPTGDLNARTGALFFGLLEGRLVAACGASLGTGVAKTMRWARIVIERGLAVDADELVDASTNLRRLARAEAS